MIPPLPLKQSKWSQFYHWWQKLDYLQQMSSLSLATVIISIPLAAMAASSNSHHHLAYQPLTKPQVLGERTDQPTVLDGCVLTGCFRHICHDTQINNVYCPRDPAPEYACDQYATCEKQTNGQCGWTTNSTFNTCVADATAISATESAQTQTCRRTGCHSLVCSDHDLPSDSCDPASPQETCLNSSTCERQTNGECGWTPTTAYNTCITDLTTNAGSTLSAETDSCLTTDFNSDHTVDTTDRQLFIDHLFSTDSKYDLNHDNLVDISDYTTLVNDWGKSSSCSNN